VVPTALSKLKAVFARQASTLGKWLGAGLVALVCQGAWARSVVTFQADMSVAGTNGTFHSATQTVVVKGSFNGWGATPLPLTNNPNAGNTNIYTGSYDYGANQMVMDYKFVLEPGDVWEGMSGNRVALLPAASGGSVLLPAAYFNDVPPGAVPTNVVSFQVDMAEQIYLGAFTRGSSTVYGRGAFDGWGLNLPLTNNPSIRHTNAFGLVSTDVYVGSFGVLGAPGTTAEYKFYIDTSDKWESPVWGDPLANQNRFFTLSAGPQVLPIADFNDIPYGPTVTNVVTFQVDMSIERLEGRFDPALDTVDVRGTFNGWRGGVNVATNTQASGNTNLYTAVVAITNGVGATEQYKFAYTTNANSGVAWEVPGPNTPQMGGNRIFTMANTNVQTLPAVAFSDLAVVILTQPATLLVVPGSNATFSLTAAGAPPLSYQWRTNGTALSYGTNGSLTVGAYTYADLTNAYDVVVANAYGSVTSQVARLIMGPYLFIQPTNQTVPPGSNATLNVVVAGSNPMSYQWRFNGMPLSDPLATNSSYTVFAAAWNNSGNYDVVVNNAGGSATSQVAVLSVRDLAQPVIYPPSNVVAQCTGPDGAMVYYAITATDPYDPSPSVTCTPPPGSVFPIGWTTVSCVATDSLGNISSGYFTVQVTGTCDAGYIAVTCPQDIQVNLGAQPTVAVDFSVGATNMYSGLVYPVQCTPPPGSQFPMGTNVVTCIATRGGASNVCVFNVVVRDVTPPRLQVPPTIAAMNAITNASGQVGAYVYYQVNAADNVGVTVTTDHPSGSFFPSGTNVVRIVATDLAGNSTTNTLLVALPAYEVATNYCGDLNADNWGFENECLTGWGVYGDFTNDFPIVAGDYLTVKRIPQLGSQLTNTIGGDYWRDLYYPVGHHGTKWVCTGCRHTYGPAGNIDDRFNDALMGSLLSKSFVITNDYITFLIGGNNDGNVAATKLRVELLVQAHGIYDCYPSDPENINGTSYCIHDSCTGHDSELLRRAWFSVQNLKGVRACLRIIDDSPNGHLNVDDFRFQDIEPDQESVIVGGNSYPAVASFITNGVTYYYDWDSPLWGFADMHTHPTSCLGFGQRLMHGWPDGAVPDNNADHASDVEHGLASCNDKNIDNDHGGVDFIAGYGDYWRQLLANGVDGGGPEPHGAGWDSDPFKCFSYWPVFSSISHQQMWYDWIRRAYNGGERVMVALAVNNELLATASKGQPNAPLRDLEVGDTEIAALTNFVARHNDFMEMAYDPFQLRDIVRRNKMAIILGSELDDLGNLAHNTLVLEDHPEDNYTSNAVWTAIDHLYSQGVRYMFTVHLADNKFGGTPICDDMLNFGTKFQNGGTPLSVEPADESDHINFWLFTTFQTEPLLNPGVRAGIGLAWFFGGPAVIGYLVDHVQDLVSSGVPTIVPPGAASACLAPILPILAAATYFVIEDPNAALPFLLYMAGLHDPNVTQLAQAHLLPVPENYPHYPEPTNSPPHTSPYGPPYAPCGVRNVKGLTPLGRLAVLEMMKRGMMLDSDHLSQHTWDGLYGIATTNLPSGPLNYPLNSGHNSFRELWQITISENHRTADQLDKIRSLGGLMGVGWEDGSAGAVCNDFTSVIPDPQYSSSVVPNDCAGTSKTWAQLYLYALEKLHGQNVAFGTDADGMIQFPGPRFGPQSAYGLGGGSNPQRAPQITAQVVAHNGVLYTNSIEHTKYGHPPMTAWANGRSIDTDSNDEKGPITSGYKYSQEQAAFFSALSYYYNYVDYNRINRGSLTKDQIGDDCDAFQDELSDHNVNCNHTMQYAKGMLWTWGGYNICTEDCDLGICECGTDQDNGNCQELGKSIYLSQEAHGSPLAQVMNDSSDEHGKRWRYFALVSVWNDYQAIFGTNTPMIRCQTGYRQWDINFEGVAHYGLIPDFLQDLSNGGLNSPDMSVLFRSAEGFARMWNRCLEASSALGGHTFVMADCYVSATSVLLGPNRWQVAGSFQSVSTNAVGYNLQGSTVDFVGATNTHLLYQPSADLGAGQSALTNNYAFGTVQLEGSTVTVISNRSYFCGPGAVYVETLTGSGILNIGPGVRFYFGSTNGWTGTVSVTGDGVFQQLQPDSVGDGIPDWWRQQYFGGNGTTNDSRSCATCDADGTGQNNWFKYVAGLDPTNPASVFRLRVRVAGQTNQPQLTFSPRWTNRTYTVVFCTNLVSGALWRNLTNSSQSDNGTERTVTDLGATQTSKFYRVQISYP